MDDAGGKNEPRTIEPLGVDVRKRREKLSASIVAVLVVSSVIAVVLCAGATWFLLLKLKRGMIIWARPCQVRRTRSLCSSMATYTGANRTFSLGEMERATGKFDDSRIVGEGGFGRVYQGALEDGTMVAVKIEMLSRLHHRNLVKLIGLCAEEHLRCLVYELIPNGSVESHLHGVDREVAPLDWASRIKIALGSARPPVIHRDFKSSNILLEHNFTPKVSDFGLARAALNEGRTISQPASWYALTGHLLVKSDVYSYGVVLLELLTGRKPVDMSQPPGQENLVAWAIVDPALGSSVPFDGVAKVAAIASMCVQPEVSHRPSMGEVVQALKLVCNDGDNPGGSGRSFNPEDEEAVIGAASSFSVSANPRTSAGFAAEARGSLRRHSSSSEPLRTGGSGRFSARNEVLVRRKPER
ncbi:unnamed protein product [Spirodela intermedia]|uniref:Protein kinase domain-containing protein n=1 Tax=Spirodela intermedia TaxID=51605 RepID=A0A7I8J7D8_SPIIN|nr:unnamed protein product [Spirodela intermedia]CAA6666146.1 unnamed protein product [Spirodela intermedia]